MIKIEPSSPLSGAKRASAKKKSGDNAFSVLMDSLGGQEAAGESASVNATSALSSLDMILSVQGIPEEITRRQQQIKQAELTLDSLEQLRNALLMGQVPMYLLHDIERRMSAMRNDVDDTLLCDIIEDIELRAAVELAKYRMDSV